MKLFKTLILSFIITYVIPFPNVSGQVITDSIYNNEIHTVQLFREGMELSYPVITINLEDKLRLSFDDFSKDLKNYCYTLVHCNSDWEPTNLSYPEYADGFEQNQITDHAYSTNTLVNYIHYSIVFPNDKCNPRISGNYIIKVFTDFDTSKVVFTRRFYLTETTASINLNTLRPEIPKYMLKFQQFKISLIPNVTGFIDLKNEIKVVISQNGMPCRTMTNLISRLVHDNTLIYDDLDANVFEGGNEFRNFDIKSIKYQSQQIKKIEYSGPYYSIELYLDTWKTKTRYFFDNDLNGNYFIENTLGIDKNNDADYVMVHFTLPLKEPLVDGDLFVYGALTDWACNQASKMSYNLETHTYELKLLLKQGYYNYQYAYKPYGSDKIDLIYVEGSNYETENNYLVFVYYKQFSSRYERLIGYRLVNTIKKGDSK